MKKHVILLVFFFLGLFISAMDPHDYFTWFMEIFPALIGCVVLALTYKRFTFTYLTYCFILAHCCVLFIGGHYTYAEVPLFDWIRESFNQSRNNYDKVGHFTQGFVPALITRELFIRLQVVRPGSWLSFLTVTTCVFISVFYEFLEWAVAVISGELADSFLGTQGYVWDTQSDMLYATIGATCMLIFLSKIQDKHIHTLTEPEQ